MTKGAGWGRGGDEGVRTLWGGGISVLVLVLPTAISVFCHFLVLQLVSREGTDRRTNRFFGSSSAPTRWR